MTAAVTVATLAAELAAERDAADDRPIAAEAVGVDPTPTVPLSLLELVDPPDEVDRGRPLHELDYALRMGGAR
ncbi:hypothetical protein [Nocardia arizonensis]|uniref:hypothetical protein n=1 Tax=Nocardia arizonensis TaxID=1141647 RepID=UPI0006CF61FB|nr:hypothetical protein [Nocardia arizonensis]